MVSSDCSGKEAIPSHITVPPPRSEVCSFDWNSLTEPSLPSDIPFQICVKVAGKDIFRTIVDEGASVSILSSTAWQAIGSPQLVPANEKILAFNRRPTGPLGILPQLPIALGGKIVCINVMVVQGPLDFNLLLGRDYVYAMKAVASKLFRVMYFPHHGNIVTINQLSFVTPNHRMTASHQTSLNVPHVLVVPPPSSSMSLGSSYHTGVNQ